MRIEEVEQEHEQTCNEDSKEVSRKIQSIISLLRLNIHVTTDDPN